MYTLIKLLHNTSKDTWHPIFYFESPLPSQQPDDDLIRFESKGHHTTGVKTLGDAIIESVSVETRLKEQGNIVFSEMEPVLVWDGIETPVDVIMRNLKELKEPVKDNRPD